MICRDEVLLPAARGKEKCGCRVVATVSQELQGEEGVSRATLAQIQFNRIRRPRAVGRPHHDKIDCKPAQHTLTSQPVADPLRIRADLFSILEISRKRTPQIALPA